MQKLKERISQLDQENQSLMVHKKNDFDGDNDTNLDVQSLIERILRYMGSATLNVLTCVFILLASLMEKKTENQFFFVKILVQKITTHTFFFID